MILMMVGVFVIMYFLMIRPQKKKQKEEQAMRDNLQIGDEITTIGGIVGKIVTVKDDSLIIETGADRNRMKITRWAISQNNTANEKLAAERAAAKEAAEKEKAARMEAKGKTPKAKKKKEEKF
ncbi:MAG TPA: preprotein translocase subunit YajC [Ruminococcaceae bacterium]|nr:preprotein translocase subunit YajC [Oscillospiraceae bacterium]